MYAWWKLIGRAGSHLGTDRQGVTYSKQHSILQKNAILLEKFRQMEQDRGLLLSNVESERSKLLLLREERIKLYKERSDLRACEAQLKENLQNKPSYLQVGSPKKDLASFRSLELAPSRQWQSFNAGNAGENWTANFSKTGPHGDWESFGG